jgi:YHS domain-containing protein
LSDERTPQVRDPVCGKTFDVANAAAMADYSGWAYFFCSAQCRDAFARSPDRFANRPATPCPEGWRDDA